MVPLLSLQELHLVAVKHLKLQELLPAMVQLLNLREPIQVGVHYRSLAVFLHYNLSHLRGINLFRLHHLRQGMMTAGMMIPRSIRAKYSEIWEKDGKITV